MYKYTYKYNANGLVLQKQKPVSSSVRAVAEATLLRYCVPDGLKSFIGFIFLVTKSHKACFIVQLQRTNTTHTILSENMIQNATLITEM